MKVIRTPLVLTDGIPRIVPYALWNGLFDKNGLFPRMAHRTMHCALAYIRVRAGGRQALSFLQCVRINFDGLGAPVTWNMSTLHLKRECELDQDAFPAPRTNKYNQEPHYWFPDALELGRIAHALSPRPAQDFKN